MAKLGNICKFQSGGTPAKGDSTYYGGKIPWITTVALNGGIIGNESAIEWITEKALRESAAKLVPAYSIMIGTRVGVGKVAINREEMSTSQDIISLIGINDTRWNKPYLCRFLQAKSDFLNAQARGATIKGIKIEVLSELDIPEITLVEQQRVADIFDKLSTLILKRQEQLRQMDLLVKSRFVEMFGESRANPKGWNIIKLGQLADVGSSKRVFVEELRNDGIPFYRGTEVGALAEGQLITPELYITEQHYRSLIKATGAPAKGDLLMPSICSDGRIWLVDTDAPFYFKDGRVLWIHPTSRELDSRYLQHVLKEKIMTDYSSIASGTTFAELKIFALKALCVIVPPLELQNQFSTFVAQVDKSKLAVKQSLEKLETLKKSLMQQYFG